MRRFADEAIWLLRLAFAYSSAAADGGATDDARLGAGWSFDLLHIHPGVKIDLNYIGLGQLNPFIANAAAYQTWYVTKVMNTLTVSGVGAWTTRWTYDAADRMSTMTNPDGEVVTATYDAAGQALGLESAWPAGSSATTRTGT